MENRSVLLINPHPSNNLTSFLKQPVNPHPFKFSFSPCTPLPYHPSFQVPTPLAAARLAYCEGARGVGRGTTRTRAPHPTPQRSHTPERDLSVGRLREPVPLRLWRHCHDCTGLGENDERLQKCVIKYSFSCHGQCRTFND